MRNTRLFLLLCLLLASTSCNKLQQLANRWISRPTERDAVMQVGNNVLYLDHIKTVMPEGLSGQDSIVFAQNYMQHWATNLLMYDKAIQNVDATAEIDEMAENYRRELIINAYQQQLVAQKIDGPTEDALRDLYEQESAHFLLEEPMVKGIFIKVPTNASNQRNLSKWLRDITDENLEEITNYCSEQATIQELFLDNWMPFARIISFLPDHVSFNDPRLSAGTLVEQSEEFCYYLRITDQIAAGQPRPFELARTDLEHVMSNRLKLQYIKNFQENLYQQALKKGDVVILEPTSEQ